MPPDSTAAHLFVTANDFEIETKINKWINKNILKNYASTTRKVDAYGVQREFRTETCKLYCKGAPSEYDLIET